MRDNRSHRIVLALGGRLYGAVEAVSRHERCSLPRAVRRLIEEGLHARAVVGRADDLTATESARLAIAGGAFEWLADEPDLYDDAMGQPV